LFAFFAFFCQICENSLGFSVNELLLTLALNKSFEVPDDFLLMFGWEIVP
jgi:hypothetical protein